MQSVVDSPIVQTFKVGWNVEVLGFKADYVSTYDDYLSFRKRTQGLIYQETLNNQLLPELMYYSRQHNLIPNVGLDLIATRLLDNSKNFISHCSVGQGADGTLGNTNAPAAGDTALQGQLGSRKAIGSPYLISVGQAKWDTFFLVGDNAGSWTEVGLHNAAAAGDMLARVKLGSVFTKVASGAGANTASVNWGTTGTAVADV